MEEKLLELKNINKEYEVGKNKVHALKDINLQFRKKEFVAILGPSGCGKTTLLNLLGGLDRATSGDLIIEGTSTSTFKSRDWDRYRNHSIGFVFQNYLLIEHQNIGNNIELALKIGAHNKAERKDRVKKALESVKLSDQINKKPAQLSGGQSQRIAIARAMVTDPKIILADEPTGALDSETGLMVMGLLKEVSEERLVVMVTHNAELAEKYATRIIRLKDGQVLEDSNPPVNLKSVEAEMTGKSKMNFFTAAKLSLDNLREKLGRTILTAFAGSIGIIGIALILALSQGAREYIDYLQKDTLASYPIELNKSGDTIGMMVKNLKVEQEDKVVDKVRALGELQRYSTTKSQLTSSENNLEAFSKYMKEKGNLSFISSVQKDFDLDIPIYTLDEDEEIVYSNTEVIVDKISELSSERNFMIGPLRSVEMFSQLMPSKDGLVNEQLKNRYELVAGKWPDKANEIILKTDFSGSVPDMVIYALGVKSQDELNKYYEDLEKNKSIVESTQTLEYEKFVGKKLKWILSEDRFEKDDEKFPDGLEADEKKKYLFDNGKSIDLELVGIVRSLDDKSPVQGYVGVTQALIDKVMEENKSSQVVKKQMDNPEIDAITGTKFEPTDVEKNKKFYKDELETASDNYNNEKKAEIYRFAYTHMPKVEYEKELAKKKDDLTQDEKDKMIIDALTASLRISETRAKDFLKDMSSEDKDKNLDQILGSQIRGQYQQKLMPEIATLTNKQAAKKFDEAKKDYNEEELEAIYEQYLVDEYSESDYMSNLKKMGYVEEKDVESILLYASKFEDKEEIGEFIDEYNKGVEENDKMKYTDLVALLMSSITNIISGISLLLIVFVAISLVVSSIMIGIITSISVMERTKEIGILRALGASKANIVQVFSSETLIEGLAAGLLGNLIAFLLLIPINKLIYNLTQIDGLKAVLSPKAVIILTLISVVLTFIAGLIPSMKAARKDPVEALRSL